MSYSVYLIIFRDYLYTGQTANLGQRLEEHGPEAKLLYSEEHASRSEAMKREHQIKGWTRAKKLALAEGDIPTLKSLSKRYPKISLSMPKPSEGMA